MIKFDSKSKKQLLELYETKKVGLEGNILKLIDVENDVEFSEYINSLSEKDKETRRKRLEMTKQIQSQNKQLTDSKKELEDSQKSLQDSLDQIQISMKEAEEARQESERLRAEAEEARIEAEKAKEEALRAKEFAEIAKSEVENDLDILQRKTQNELIGTIVKVALFVICGVGFITTGVYLLAIFTDKDTQVIASTWANIVGILLTNAFSIVGTIMGVKYASEK